MSDSKTGAGTAGEAVKEVVNNALEQAKNRLNSHYFSFILTSLIAFNWQHILVLIMSKKDIEVILKMWGDTEGFALNYLIIPVVTGYIASFLFPLFAIPVALFTSIVGEFIKASDDWAVKFIGRLKASWRSQLDLRIAERDENSKRRKQIEYELEYNSNKVNRLTEQRTELEDYFAKLTRIYIDHPHLKTAEELEQFVIKVADAGLLSVYPASSSVWAFLHSIRSRGENQTPSTYNE